MGRSFEEEKITMVEVGVSAVGVVVPFWAVLTVQILLMVGEAAYFIWYRK